jgi:hypothetical protein
LEWAFSARCAILIFCLCGTAPETAEKVGRRSLCQGVFEPQDLSRLLTQFKSNFIPLSAWVTAASSPVGLMVAVVARIPELASDCWRSHDPAVACSSGRGGLLVN